MNLNEIKKRVADIELVNNTEPITTLNVPMTVNEMKAILSLNERYAQQLEIAKKALEGVINVIEVQGVARDIGTQEQWDAALVHKVKEARKALEE